MNRYAGCIHDSGPPFNINSNMISRAFVAALLGLRNKPSTPPGTHEDHHLLKHQAQYQHWLLTPISKFIFWLFLKMPIIQNDIKNVLDAFINIQVKLLCDVNLKII